MHWHGRLSESYDKKWGVIVLFEAQMKTCLGEEVFCMCFFVSLWGLFVCFSFGLFFFNLLLMLYLFAALFMLNLLYALPY